VRLAGAGALGLALLAGVFLLAKAADDGRGPARDADHRPAADTDSVELSPSQMQMIVIGPVSDREFPVRTDAVGSIDFNEDLTGTGVGLFFVKMVVDLHRGSVTAESRQGGGSRFTVRLPLAPEHA
jgi:sensor histidine kinase regulating citrate/malate metabolism